METKKIFDVLGVSEKEFEDAKVKFKKAYAKHKCGTTVNLGKELNLHKDCNKSLCFIFGRLVETLDRRDRGLIK